MLKNVHKNKILYIPNWVPSLEQSDDILKIFKKYDNFFYFNWKIESDNNAVKMQTYPITKIESLCEQILSFFNKQKDCKVDVIINSFSLLIIYLIYDEIKHKINKLILLNPFDKSIYLKVTNIKGKIIPNNNQDAFLKYMYLANNLSNLRNNKKMINSIHQEVVTFSDLSLLYHKIFDQILKIRTINNYFKWIEKIRWNTYIIVGEKNPLINLNKNKKLFNANENNYFIIKNVGYCLTWEDPEQLRKVIEKII